VGSKKKNQNSIRKGDIFNMSGTDVGYN